MRIIAIVLNVIMVLFTLMVFVTDGLATKPLYLLFSILLVLVPVINIVVFAGRRKPSPAGEAAPALRARNPVIIANLVLVAAVIWVLIQQGPHPQEPGYVEYVILLFLAPIFSLLTILRQK